VVNEIAKSGMGFALRLAMIVWIIVIISSLISVEV